jgi:MOSC domain-containing protein YiiM
MPGTLIGIVRRPRSRAPMEKVDAAQVSRGRGLSGDSKGVKFPKRQITILQRELWETALFTLGNPPLEWTARRANLLVENIHLPRGIGSRLRVGPAELEVTAQTTPCARMDELWPGLRRALAPDWRGGITCKVVQDGHIALGDQVEIVVELPERKVHLLG